MTQSCPLQFSGNSSEQGGAELDQAQVELEEVVKVLFEKFFFAIKRQLIYYLNDKIITRLSLLNVKTKCFNFRQDDSQVF